MKYYNVSFQYSESVYCSNIAHAETVEDVEKHYSKYAYVKVSEASEYDVKDAQRRGKPLVECPHVEDEEQAEEPAAEEAEAVEETTEDTEDQNNTMTKAEIIDCIIDYFEENEDSFNDCIESLDNWNGYLNDDRYYSMEDLDELYYGVDPTEILRRAFFGYDAETWHTDASGNRIYGAFNPNRDYFHYNGYGNLISSDYKDYSNYLCVSTIEDFAENRAHILEIDDDSELSELFYALEEADEE